jgi:exosome complex component CSL4
MAVKYVAPGQYLGTAEEYIPGEGTYEDNGRIYSSCSGIMEVDDRNYKVSIKGKEKSVNAEIGDEIIGVVSEINEPIVVVMSEYLIRNGKVYEYQNRTLVHASRIMGHFLDQASRAIKIRDVVKGRVVSTRGKIDLSLERPDDGVIYAFCSRCRKPLEKVNNGLYCRYCQRNEMRKISTKYGELPLKMER